jgi:phosphate transport system protein
MNKHISEQFDADLESARSQLMEMGGLVERQVREACAAVLDQREELAQGVRDAEPTVNRFEVNLDDHCVQTIALRQPTASDLRMMISVLKTSTDLERMGDEANRIAKMALALSGAEYPEDRYADVRILADRVIDMVSAALDSFARMDAAVARSVIRADKAVDDGYRQVLKRLVGDMQSRAEAVERSLNILWVARALERIGDHAKNISEYALYLVHGEDVRHSRNSGVLDDEAATASAAPRTD